MFRTYTFFSMTEVLEPSLWTWSAVS